MKHFALPAAGLKPVSFVAFGRRRKSLFASIFGALHESRRLQAERVLRRHQHLIDRAERRRVELEGRHHVDH